MKESISKELKAKIDDKLAYIRNELVSIVIELEADSSVEEIAKVVSTMINTAGKEAVAVLALRLGLKNE